MNALNVAYCCAWCCPFILGDGWLKLNFRQSNRLHCIECLSEINKSAWSFIQPMAASTRAGEEVILSDCCSGFHILYADAVIVLFVCLFVCVCVRERKSKIVSIHKQTTATRMDAVSNVIVCLCLWEREWERGRACEMELIFGSWCSFFLGELFQWCVGV